MLQKFQNISDKLFNVVWENLKDNYKCSNDFELNTRVLDINGNIYNILKIFDNNMLRLLDINKDVSIFIAPCKDYIPEDIFMQELNIELLNYFSDYENVVRLFSDV